MQERVVEPLQQHIRPMIWLFSGYPSSSSKDGVLMVQGELVINLFFCERKSSTWRFFSAHKRPIHGPTVVAQRSNHPPTPPPPPPNGSHCHPYSKFKIKVSTHYACIIQRLLLLSIAQCTNKPVNANYNEMVYNHRVLGMDSLDCSRHALSRISLFYSSKMNLVILLICMAIIIFWLYMLK